METLNQFYQKNDRKILLTAACFLAIIFTLTLVTDNPELPYTNNQTQVCQPNQSLLNYSMYYDNESQVCWNPDTVNTSDTSEGANNG